VKPSPAHTRLCCLSPALTNLRTAIDAFLAAFLADEDLSLKLGAVTQIIYKNSASSQDSVISSSHIDQMHEFIAFTWRDRSLKHSNFG
jgi:hypothetical protein